MMNKNKIYDVIIAGGGPAGSTSATLLAQYGYQVLLIESSQHPRFHIGESMLPMIEPVLKRLNIDWNQGNLVKSGADFIDETTGRQDHFPFKGKYHTVQLERAVFDELLFNNATKYGVETHQQEKVIEVEFKDNGVDVITDTQAYQGRYFIDATGRNALMGRKTQTIQRLDNLGRFALYQQYRLVPSASADNLFKHGNIKILLVDIGWLWCIPLTQSRLSIGLVVRKLEKGQNDKQALFEKTVQNSPLLNQLLAGADLLANLRTEADFSYINQQRYGIRYACCGDAGGFLDPVFSSGCFFAIKTAEMLADRLHQGFKEGREADPELHQVDEADYQQGFQTMYLMIERFYRSDMVNNLFFEADRVKRLKTEVTAILAGDLWQKNNSFQQGLLSGRGKPLK